jgi:hypothetical protein
MDQFQSGGIKHSLNHPGESQKALDAVIQKPFVSSLVARVYAWRGERGRALDWLERAYAEHNGGMVGIKYDLILRPLHGEPRFKALLKKMNLPED